MKSEGFSLFVCLFIFRSIDISLICFGLDPGSIRFWLSISPTYFHVLYPPSSSFPIPLPYSIPVILTPCHIILSLSLPILLFLSLPPFPFLSHLPFSFLSLSLSLHFSSFAFLSSHSFPSFPILLHSFLPLLSYPALEFLYYSP